MDDIKEEIKYTKKATAKSTKKSNPARSNKARIEKRTYKYTPTKKSVPKKIEKKNNTLNNKKSKTEKIDKKNEKKLRKINKKHDKILKKEQKSKIIKPKSQKVNNKAIQTIFSKDGLRMSLAIIFIATMLMLIVYRYTKITDLRYSINKAITELEELEKEIKVEKTKIDDASRSDIIEKKATENLGLVHIRQNQKEYITVD